MVGCTLIVNTPIDSTPNDDTLNDTMVSAPYAESERLALRDQRNERKTVRADQSQEEDKPHPALDPDRSDRRALVDRVGHHNAKQRWSEQEDR